MDKLISGVLLLALVFFLVGCSDTGVASTEAQWGDKPAAITCYTYGVLSFNGWSTGRTEYDDAGRLSFVDQANGRFTVIEGDCRVVYSK